MRPIHKGHSPYLSINRYGDALPYLAERIGLYCSYCEFPIFHAPEVEHVVSKSEGGDTTAWHNLLLGCKYCNTRKSAKITPENVDEYAWPDSENTAIMFSYKNGIPSVNRVILQALDPSGQLEQKADNLFQLVKLRNIPTPREKDRRFSQRNEVYVIACDALNDWVAARKYPPKLQEIAKNGIIRTAIANGFFSVWMEVFSDEAEICQALIRAFPGTAGDCFDSDGSPLAACRIHSQPVCV